MSSVCTGFIVIILGAIICGGGVAIYQLERYDQLPYTAHNATYVSGVENVIDNSTLSVNMTFTLLATGVNASVITNFTMNQYNEASNLLIKYGIGNIYNIYFSNGDNEWYLSNQSLIEWRSYLSYAMMAMLPFLLIVGIIICFCGRRQYNTF